MPLLSRALLRAALCWLAVAFVLLCLIAAGPLSPSLGRFGVLGATAVHALVAGFTMQVIFGVALWMFPRPSSPPGGGHGVLGWTIFAGLNLGLVLRLVAEPLMAFVGSAAWGRVLVASALLQAAAVISFVILAWPRVRAASGRGA